MNTIDFEESRHFTEHLVRLLAQGEYKTFQCLIADHGLTLTDFVDLTINALLPPPDLTGYYHAVQRYITTGDIQ
jgi:hypothetical protein